MSLFSLPDLSVKKPIAMSMVLLCIALLGAITFRMLPVEMMPNTSFGDITINIDVRGGMPASEVEKRITKLVEEAVGSVTHLKDMIAISKEGNATIILEFEPGTNMEFAALEVREKFNRIRNKLPAEIEKPVVAKYEYMDVPIMILAITSELRDPEELRNIVDDKIKDRIQRIEGVANAEIVGGREAKVIIEVDQRKLHAYGLPINRVVDIINLNNENALAGEVQGTRNKYLVRTIGEFKTVEDIADLAIASTKEGSVIRLKDVATVKDSYLDPTSYSRFNANPVVSIYIQKESTANTVKISKLVNEEIRHIKKTLEKDVKLNLTFNQSEAIEKAVEQVMKALFQGAEIVIIILLLFLGRLWLRPFAIPLIFAMLAIWDAPIILHEMLLVGTLVVMLLVKENIVLIMAASIPLSLLFTFTLMYFFKLSINVISLSGLALGIGMLVDNSVVVLDNILKKRDHIAKNPNAPKAPWEKITAIEGADEMLLAITSSTLTHNAVFFPLIFISPEIQRLYSGIALTIIFSLFASLFTALTLVPMLVSKMRIKPQYKTTGADQDVVIVVSPIAKITDFFNMIIGGIYKGIISLSLMLRYPVLALCVMACAWAVGESQKLEKEFIGIAEQNKFTIFIEMPTGTKIDVTNAIVQKIEKIVAQTADVRASTSKVEPWSSKIYVELASFEKRKRPVSAVINELRPITTKFEPAFIYFEEPEEVGTKEIILEIFGYDYAVLKNLAVQIAQKIQGIPRFTDTKIRMREGRPELHLLVDKMQAAYFGLTVENISLTLHTNTRGLVATRYRGKQEPMVRVRGASDNKLSTGGASTGIRRTDADPSRETKETETIVRLEEQFRKSFEALRRTVFIGPEGLPVYLHQVAKFKFDVGPSEIWRKNKSRMVQVSANTGGTALGTAAANVKEALKDLKLPKDTFWRIGGQYDKMLQNQRELTIAGILSLVLVFMILASLFESLFQPFIILTTVPLAAIGAIWALRHTGKPVGMGVLVGGIMLGGIAVNNAIVLVDRINFFLKQEEYLGKPRKAAVDASYDRLRPILITTLTTILGLVPMAMDKSESANLWAPLAITVIGGMTVSSFLTLFVIPGVFMIFNDIGWIFKFIFRWKK